MTDDQEPKAEPGKDPKPEPPKDGQPKGDDQPTGEEKREQTGGDDVAELRKEAAGYRHKLREAEAERDRLAARITDYDRAEVERQVTGQDGLQNAADFWLAVQLDDLRDDEGKLDSDKVKAARDHILSEHPNWREPGPNFDGGVRQPAIDDQPSFGRALKEAGTG